MATYLRGIHVPHRKNTAGMSAVRMDIPKSVTIPTKMHIGKAATPVVKKGDTVKVGTLIAQQNGLISSPVYASVSGTVTKVDDYLTSSGETVPAITIESDGEMNLDEAIKAPVVNNRETFIEAVKNSGIVGLGGAGFPTYVKFGADKPLEIEEFIINGAECEPYITSDSVTMVDNADDIATGIDAVIKYLGVKKVIIGIEKNKPAAIKSMQKLAESDKKISVKVLPAVYPQGGEKVLVYHTTGKVIGEGKLPIDVKCVVCNSSTVANIGKYLKTGKPLTEKCITVDGCAVKEPKNIIVPIGTSIAEVFDFCGGLKCDPDKILYGGPMMGISVPDTSVVVIKNTNAVLALTAKETRVSKQTACIKCGACTNNCPFGLNPAVMEKAYREKNFEWLEKLSVNMCMECGCCAFSCPAKRPLVQNNKLAKADLRKFKEKEAAK